MATRPTTQTRTKTADTPALAEAPVANLPAINDARIPYHPGLAERFNVDKTAWRALVDAIFPNAKSIDSVILALSYCKARGLDVFKRPCHIVSVWNSEQRRYVDSIWSGIGELRTTASRTGSYAGFDECRFGPEIEMTFEGNVGKEGNERHVHAAVKFPEWAQVTVYRMVQGQRVPFPGPKVFWLETYATIGKSDVPNDMWQTRPYGQIEKCYSPDTEVLTDAGFQRFDAVTARIMQVTNNGIEPTDAGSFRQEWHGPMIVANGDGLNFSVTPNHDILTEDGKLSAETLYDHATSNDKFRIPISVASSRPDAAISDRAIQLAAAFVCDGWRRPYGTFCVSVSRPYKIQALDRIGGFRGRRLRRCAGDEAETETRVVTTSADKTEFSFDEKSLEGLVELDKMFDRERLLSLSRRQAKLMIDTMIEFDGADNGHGTMRFYSSRTDILAAFEIAAVAAGYAVSQRRTRISDIGGPNHTITLSDKTSLPVLRYSASQSRGGSSKAGIEKSESNHAGEVWCCKVPSGLIVVRRAGLSMICGNCAEAAALRRAFPEELGDDHIPDEVGRVLKDVTPPAPTETRPTRAETARPGEPTNTVEPNLDQQFKRAVSGTVPDAPEPPTEPEPDRTTPQGEMPPIPENMRRQEAPPAASAPQPVPAAGPEEAEEEPYTVTPRRMGKDYDWESFVTILRDKLTYAKTIERFNAWLTVNNGMLGPMHRQDPKLYGDFGQEVAALRLKRFQVAPPGR